MGKLGFNVTLTAKVISWQSPFSDAHDFRGFLTPVITQISFLCHRLLFSHTSAEVSCEYLPERKFASTRYQTHNRQVKSPSPLSNLGRVTWASKFGHEFISMRYVGKVKKKCKVVSIFSVFHNVVALKYIDTRSS